MEKFIEIMDTTLRDGEQTNSVSFVPHEKLLIARMLLTELNATADAATSTCSARAVSVIASSS